MKIKALITMLVLGASSVAMARPVAPTSQAQPDSTVRDHRMPSVAQAEPYRPYRPDPRDRGRFHRRAHRVDLGSGLSFGQGRTFVTVGEAMGRFDTLRIEGSTGRTLIEQVYVEFGNGQEQVFRGVNRVLDPGEPLLLDLDGMNRVVKRIVVYGKPVTRTGYGYGRHGTFNISAA